MIGGLAPLAWPELVVRPTLAATGECRWILRCAADEQLRFVILNEVKDPAECCRPATR